MRVAMLHPYTWPAVRRGAERYLHDLSLWLHERGHEVDVLTGPTEADPDLPPGPRLLPLPLHVPHRLARHDVTALDTFGVSTLPYLLRQRYDVVHSLVPSGGLAAAHALQPSVYSVLGHPSPANPPRHRWSRELFARAIRAVRLPAALSSSAATGVEALTGRRPIVLSPGVRLAEFPRKPAPPVGPPVLLFNAFAGDPRKRLGVLLAALPALLDEHPGLRLQLGGGGSADEALDGLDRGVREAVLPVLDDLGAGPLRDVPERYRRATVCVLPSVEEAFGLVLVESLAAGTPVVCSASGGMPEIVTPDVGRVVPPDSPSDLAGGIREALLLAADEGTLERCRARARRWDWDVVGPLHEHAYARARA
ncbi:MAG: glycosyltransferase family 4 protein [Mycobacteriales bacterium]